jgi:acyl-CoA synthetase (AMP-forming)/AMP-acid ligase II
MVKPWFYSQNSDSIIADMNLFTQLRQHAQTQPETIAYASRHRIATYRKLWSRIERGTARLQGEWGIRRGDVVAYCGQGHPDALVLYVALARCGALLAPLEHASLQARMDEIVREYRIKVVLHDDQAPVESIATPALIAPVSALIDTRCPYQSSGIVEDPAQPSLIIIDPALNRNVRGEQKTLRQMAAAASAGAAPAHRIAGSLFDERLFAALVLPVLMAGRTLHFD